MRTIFKESDPQLYSEVLERLNTTFLPHLLPIQSLTNIVFTDIVSRLEFSIGKEIDLAKLIEATEKTFVATDSDIETACTTLIEYYITHREAVASNILGLTVSFVEHLEHMGFNDEFSKTKISSTIFYQLSRYSKKIIH